MEVSKDFRSLTFQGQAWVQRAKNKAHLWWQVDCREGTPVPSPFQGL